jgi:hypothetical protein
MQKNIWLSTAHIPGVTNVEADRKSRKFNFNTEWALNDDVFAKICTVFVLPELDLFASRLNRKFDCIASTQHSVFTETHKH